MKRGDRITRWRQRVDMKCALRIGAGLTCGGGIVETHDLHHRPGQRQHAGAVEDRSRDATGPREWLRLCGGGREGGAWSPDGHYVAFISDRGKQTDVWVVPSAGGEERRVTSNAAEEQAPLVWRAGSKALTFGVTNSRRALWSLNLAGGTEQRLTIDSVRYGDWYLSPDGRLASVVIEHGGGARDLAVVPVGERRVSLCRQKMVIVSAC